MGKQSRISGALAVTIAQAVVLALGYVTHFWVGRALGPGSYGIFGLALSLQTIIGLAQTQGVPMAVSRFVAQDEEHAQSILRQALRVQFGVSFCVSLITLAAAPLIARWLGDGSLTNYIRFVAAVLFGQSFFPLFPQFLAGLHQFNRQAALTVVYAVAKLTGAVGLLYVWHVYGALAGFAVAVERGGNGRAPHAVEVLDHVRRAARLAAHDGAELNELAVLVPHVEAVEVLRREAGRALELRDDLILLAVELHAAEVEAAEEDLQRARHILDADTERSGAVAVHV
jgi:hypothetical protein